MREVIDGNHEPCTRQHWCENYCPRRDESEVGVSSCDCDQFEYDGRDNEESFPASTIDKWICRQWDIIGNIVKEGMLCFSAELKSGTIKMKQVIFAIDIDGLCSMLDSLTEMINKR